MCAKRESRSMNRTLAGELGGFFGRSGAEIDQLGVVWTDMKVVGPQR